MSEWIVKGSKRSGGIYPSRTYEKVQELIRCRECICWRADKWFCTMWKVGTPDDGFCYMGKMDGFTTWVKSVADSYERQTEKSE